MPAAVVGSLLAIPGISLGQSTISGGAYALLAERVAANQTAFYVFEDADSGFNHGYPSGLFGATGKIELDPGCVDDPNGCSVDRDRLDRDRGTVLRITFEPLASSQYAGINLETSRRSST